MTRLLAKGALLLTLLASCSIAAPLKPAEHKPLANAVVLIIRHAEKPDDGDGLTPAGTRRAESYPAYFKHFQIEGHPAHFSHIFAAKDSKKSHRPRLTVEPLARALNMQLDLRFTDKDPESIAADLKAHDYGQEILISWRHGEIPDLIRALGGDPTPLVPEGKWPDSIYDRVIELHFNREGQIQTASCRMIKEHLMPGDEK